MPINAAHYVESHFDDQDEVFVYVDIQIDSKKTVKPISVKPVVSAKQEVVKELKEFGTDYKTMTKYTFYESGEKYVKVLLDFPDAKKII